MDFKGDEDYGNKKDEDVRNKKADDTGIKKKQDIGIKHEQQIERGKQRTSAVRTIKKGILIKDIHKFKGLSFSEIVVLKKKVEIGEL